MIDIIVPQWGLTMEEAVLVAWLRNVGDHVTEGDPVAEIETDKAQSDLESPATGILREVLVEPDGEVVPGQVIGRIEEV